MFFQVARNCFPLPLKVFILSLFFCFIIICSVTFAMLCGNVKANPSESLFGNGVVAAARKRIAAQNAPDCQNSPNEKASFLIRLKGVGRAGWLEPAAGRFDRGNEFSVKADKPNHKMLHWSNIESLEKASLSWSSISVLFRLIAALLAAITIRKPRFSGFFFSRLRSASRIILRSLDLITAHPSLVDVVSPMRLTVFFSGCAFASLFAP